MKANRIPRNKIKNQQHTALIEEITAKSMYGKIALVVLITWVAGFVLQMVWAYLTREINRGPLADMNKWFMLAIPLYLVAFPMGIHMTKSLPETKPEKMSFSKKNAFVIFCVSIVLIYAGSFMGTGIADILSGGRAQNIVSNEALSTNFPLFKFMAIVIIAPLMEEMLFRKMLIDKTLRYGEKKAITFSALVFGLFHMNLHQFFYAAMVGAVLAYLYVRTGRVLIPFLYHAIINFLGGFVPAYIGDNLDFEAISSMETDALAQEIAQDSTLKSQLVMTTAYYGVMVVALVLGIIFIVMRLRKFDWRGFFTLVRESVFIRSAVMNAGFVALSVLFVGMSAITLFMT